MEPTIREATEKDWPIMIKFLEEKSPYSLSVRLSVKNKNFQ